MINARIRLQINGKSIQAQKAVLINSKIPPCQVNQIKGQRSKGKFNSISPCACKVHNTVSIENAN